MIHTHFHQILQIFFANLFQGAVQMSQKIEQLSFFSKVAGILTSTFSQLKTVCDEEIEIQKQEQVSKQISRSKQPKKIHKNKTQAKIVQKKQSTEKNKSHAQLLKKITNKKQIKPSKLKSVLKKKTKVVLPKSKNSQKEVQKNRLNSTIISTIRPKQKSKSKPKKKSKVAKWQIEGKPRPPLNAFMLFLKDAKPTINQQRPQLTSKQVTTYASTLWKQLPLSQKQIYTNKFKMERIKYQKVMQEFRNKQIPSLARIRIRRRNRKLKTSLTNTGQQLVHLDSQQENEGEDEKQYLNQSENQKQEIGVKIQKTIGYNGIKKQVKAEQSDGQSSYKNNGDHQSNSLEI